MKKQTLILTAVLFFIPIILFAAPMYAPQTPGINPVPIITHSGSATISASDMYGQTHVFTGAGTGSLPAAIAGMRGTLLITTAAVMKADPNGTEYIIHDRSSLGAGVTLDSDGTAYAVVYLECVVTGYWIAYDNMGTFDGGS